LLGLFARIIDVQGLIAGVDEAGRGPLAGPVVAAAAVLHSGQQLAGVRDSKKLSAARREELAEVIQKESADWAVGVATVAEIDELNILGATMLAMRRALAALECQPDFVRIDGNRCPDVSGIYQGPMEALVGGDDLCLAIGAASILAKVTRDKMMDELHLDFPEYGFDRHRGYPTAFHRDALRQLGPTVVHRQSFRPVREARAMHQNNSIARSASGSNS
jgi:ribonuclease HII